MKIEKLTSLIVKSVPYSDQLEFLEFSDRGDQGCSVVFNWRSSSFIVSLHKGVSGFCVGEYQSGCSVGTDAALILKSLLSAKHICEENF